MMTSYLGKTVTQGTQRTERHTGMHMDTSVTKTYCVTPIAEFLRDCNEAFDQRLL